MQRIKVDKMATDTTTVPCDICGKGQAIARYVSRCYGRGETLFVIENVPKLRCLACGESYFTAQTLQEIERLKLHRQLLAEQRTVAVAVFPN